jgi:hypothetical protein
MIPRCAYSLLVAPIFATLPARRWDNGSDRKVSMSYGNIQGAIPGPSQGRDLTVLGESKES